MEYVVSWDEVVSHDYLEMTYIPCDTCDDDPVTMGGADKGLGRVCPVILNL